MIIISMLAVFDFSLPIVDAMPPLIFLPAAGLFFFFIASDTRDD